MLPIYYLFSETETEELESQAEEMPIDVEVPMLRAGIMHELATGIKVIPFSVDETFQRYIDSLEKISPRALEQELKRLPWLFPYNLRKSLSD